MSRYFRLYILYVPIFIVSPLIISLPLWALEYKNYDLHYHFELPAGWIKIPNDIINEFVNTLSNRSGVKIPNYEAGFQISANRYFTHPYILVQHLPIANATISQIVNSFKGNGGEINQQFESSGMIRSFSTSEIFVDKHRKMILRNLEADSPDVGFVKALCAICPGREGTVQVLLYALKKDYNYHLPTFVSILDSFTFDPGYEYSWLHAKSKKVERALIAGLGSVILGIIVVLISLVVALIRKLIKKSELIKCPSCDALQDATKNECTNCGYDFSNMLESETLTIESREDKERYEAPSKHDYQPRSEPRLSATDWFEKGRSLFRSSDYEQALNSFSSAIEIDPNNAMAHYCRAIVYNKLGNKKQAMNDLITAARQGHNKSREFLKAKGIAWEESPSAELRKSLEGCNFEMAKMILIRKFKGAVIHKELASLLDQFTFNPCYDTAVDLIKYDSDFLAVFELTRGGGLTESLFSRGDIK